MECQAVSGAWPGVATENGTGTLQGRFRGVAKRNDPYSRWRRLPPVFRSGEHKLPTPGDEPQRIILYLRGDILDRAEALAEQAGVPTVQEYCAGLLARAIEMERLKRQVAEVEARRGPLEGFNAIADDPNYLAEWLERSGALENEKQDTGPAAADSHLEAIDGSPSDSQPEVVFLPLDSATPTEAPSASPQPHPAPLLPYRIDIDAIRHAIGPPATERIVPEVLDTTSIELVISHVAPGGQDPGAFLPSLRRGESVAPSRVEELVVALRRVELDLQGATLLDRRLSYALHRLALESQVLLTEAWPGVFDERMVTAIRYVQEMVERILSGQDIRYYQTVESPAAEDQP
jgi:hypothetical protein